MLNREENEFLTQTGLGTPMGEVFRRFWIPALLSEEIPDADSVPVRLKLLGEDLVAFRDTNGNPGLLEAFCPHRGTSLFFGRNEEGGLRCIYHGWKFDVNGNCVDVPNALEGETYKDKVNITWYPCWDKGGIIWAYLGPKDKIPPKPAYEWLEFAEDRRFVRKYFVECNFVQALDGNFDPSHADFLHQTLDNNASNPTNRLAQDSRPRSNFRNRTYASYEDTDYGMVQTTVGNLDDGRQVARISHFYLPSYSSAGVAGPGVYSSNMYIPIDDATLYQYRLRWSYKPFSPEQIAEDRYRGYTMPTYIPGTYLAQQNKSNDYLLDRIRQKHFSFSGINGTAIQDQAVIENQWGAIADRTKEHLVSTDEAMIRVHTRLMSAARDLMEGRDLPGPQNPESFRINPTNAIAPVGASIEEAIELAKNKMLGSAPDGK